MVHDREERSPVRRGFDIRRIVTKMSKVTNPKLLGTVMITARSQVGQCPLGCKACYYNGDGYYEDKSVPNLPTKEEAQSKLVRVNDGFDSNVEMPKVIDDTRKYPYKFYNTSISRLFSEPTVLTINGRDTDETYIEPSLIHGSLATLMAIRFRINLWNIGLFEDALEMYRSEEVDTPFLLTDMRYTDINDIPKEYRQYYEKKKHIKNVYYRLNPEGLAIIFQLLKHRGVYWCGNPFNGSTYCRDCQLCVHFYCAAKARIDEQ